MTLNNEIALGGAPTPAEGLNPQPSKEEGSMPTIDASPQCRHCTVPVDSGDICTFCATYTPPETPAQRLDVAVNRVDLLRRDLNIVFREIVATAPLFAVVDVLAALGHLRHAAVAIDKAADAIEADTLAVTR